MARNQVADYSKGWSEIRDPERELSSWAVAHHSSVYCSVTASSSQWHVLDISTTLFSWFPTGEFFFRVWWPPKSSTCFLIFLVHMDIHTCTHLTNISPRKQNYL
jgi:hypothetical protein